MNTSPLLPSGSASPELTKSSLKADLAHPTITRGQMLATSILTFGLFLVYFFIPHPFHRIFPFTVLASSVFHLILYLSFNQIFSSRNITYSLMSIFNTALLGLAVHFSGGILSPFILSFFCIVISDVANNIRYPFRWATPLFVYGAVVGGEYFQLFGTVNISTADIYQHGIITLAIGIGTGALLLVTSQSYRIIMGSLRKTLSEEQEQKQMVVKKLAQLEAPSQVGLLVNKIVHDVRGPLGAISGFIKIIQKDPGLSSVSQYDCALMLEELDRIRELMNRLIKYVRPTDRQKSAICPVDLLNTVLAVVSFYPGARRVQFDKEFPPAHTYSIYANKEELQQVVFNVVKNSLEALEDIKKPLIRTCVLTDGKEISIRIEDNGKGFPQELTERIAKGSFSTKADGGGVGLLIAKEILATQDGRLEISSQEGVGTTVVLHFPLGGSLTTSAEPEVPTKGASIA